MDVISNLLLGFQVALGPQLLMFCFIGVTVGMLVGVLPGIGALAAISMALPITFYLSPTEALVMLAGIFYGTQYGGSTAAILLNIPGTATSAITCLDGYPMAKNGRAGVALFITTISSFVGSCIAIVFLMAFAPALANVALAFSSAEYFSMMMLALVTAATISVGSPLKGLAMVAVGIALGFVGVDVNSGQYRFVFGQVNLMDGINLIAIAMGLFGIAEILTNAGGNIRPIDAKSITLRSLLPTRQDWRQSVNPTLRGSGVGSVIGALPGTGPGIAAFIAYAVEKRVSKTPEEFGTGSIAGVTAPEAANNAAVQAAFIPTLSLGIPGDAVMAVLLGAMLIHGISPGPQFVINQPEMFWGLIASFWIGNLLLLILNIPLIGLWVRILAIPYHLLYPSMLFLICIGVYSIRNNVFDVYLTVAFGLVGYVMHVLRYPAVPLLLGFILGPLIEEHLRRALQISRGDLMIFLERPISAAIIGLTVLVLAWPLIGMVRRAAFRRRA